MRRRTVVWLAWVLWSAAAALAVASVALSLASRTVPLSPAVEVPGDPWVMGAGTLLVFSSPAALIIARRPSNPIGWLLYVIGLAFGGGIVASQYGLYALVTNPGALPAGLLAAWVGDSIGIVVLGLVPLLVLLFPDGKLPGRGWRPLVWTIIGTSVVLTVANSLLPYQLAGDPRMPLNPTGIHGAADALEAVTFPAAIMLLCTGLASLKALRLRYAQSRGVERQQFKWFLFGAIILILTLIVMTPFVWRGIFLPIVLGFGLFNGCIAIALLRYHLYDIDQLINRTLVYGLLTALLGAVYAGLVLVLGQLFGAGVGRDPPSWAVAGATLAVAALFQPARRRIQSVVDRRFNRRKYNAAKTVEAFSARLRDEVDLDALAAELLAVVDQTMQPTRASLWLRPSMESVRPTRV